MMIERGDDAQKRKKLCYCTSNSSGPRKRTRQGENCGAGAWEFKEKELLHGRVLIDMSKDEQLPIIVRSYNSHLVW